MRRRWWFTALVSGIAGLATLLILWDGVERGGEVERPQRSLDYPGPRLIGDTQATEESRDPAQLSNLSARYLIRADREGEPGHLVRALEMSTRATSLDPYLPEALFNRALALDRLALRYETERAWGTYLRADSDSAWAEIAETRRDVYRKPLEAEVWRSMVSQLRILVDKGDVSAVREIVKRFPQPTRELALEEVLGRWGDQFLSGDLPGARRSYRLAFALGAALRNVSGDRSVEAVALAVMRAQEAPTEPWAAGLARGHRAFREGMAAFRRLSTDESGRWFAEAVKETRRSGSSIELWAAAGRARVKAYDGDHTDAMKDFESILAEAQRQSLKSLAGWCEWGLGWIESRLGDFTQATGRFLSAEEVYRETREEENLAAIATYLGENLASLGQREEAWRHRRTALVALRDRPTSLRRHVALMDASWSAMEQGLAFAGLTFQDEALLAAKEEGDQVRLAETNWARSRILVELGQPEEALQALQRASGYTSLAPPGSSRRKLEADLAWAQGDTLRRLDSSAALAHLTASLRAYEELKVPLNFAHASYSRAQLFLDLERYSEAEEDLGRSLGILEELATHLGEDDLEVSYSESIQDIYDDLILNRWTWKADPLAALTALERARSLGSAPGEGWVRIQESLGPDAAVIEYGLLADRLLIWIISAGGIQSVQHRVDRSKLEGLVETFRAEVLRGNRPDQLELLSSTLHDLLIPPLVGRKYKLCFIPDKVLNQIPFAALYNPRTRRFLVQDHAIALAPSLAYLLPDGKPPAAPSSALLVADPTIDHSLFPSLSNLQGARAELKQVRSLFQSATFLQGDEATKAQLLDKLDSVDVFIFSGHAFSHASRPSLSHLAVAPSMETGDPGVLLARDLAGRSFAKLRLVVLSACTSVGPRSARSSGITGMARPFLQAGVRSVIGSLWAIEDRSTQDLMRSFYKDVKAGLGPVEALRNTQLHALRDSESAWRDMSSWGAFVSIDVALPGKGDRL
jgi:CHAT domain-containing protein/tetratricopeptide (TPR) repeat protein